MSLKKLFLAALMVFFMSGQTFAASFDNIGVDNVKSVSLYYDDDDDEDYYDDDDYYDEDEDFDDEDYEDEYYYDDDED